MTAARVRAMDPYPSRGGAFRVLERKDPVVWGSTGPLGPDALRELEARGVLFFPGFFDEDETRALQQEAERRRAIADVASEQVVLEPGAEGAASIRSIFAVHRTPGPLADMPRHPRLLAIAEQILGGAAYIHQSRVNYKPGFDGKPFYWHSDFETWHQEDGMPRMRCFSCAVLLSETTEHNGPLMVFPGSHRVYVSCAGETPERNFERSLRDQVVGVPDRPTLERFARDFGIESPKGPPGSVILFDCNVMHGSNGNITPWPRHNLFYVFNAVDNALVAPYCGQAPRPEHIASRRIEALTPCTPCSS